MKYETQITLDITVHYDAVPASRGHTDGRFGPQISPDEPGYIDVWRVKDSDGREIELTERQLEEVKAEIAGHLCERDD